MRIVISGMFWSQPAVGMGQYLHGLLDALVRVAPEHSYTLLLPATAMPAPALPDGVTARLVQTPFDRRSENLSKVWFEQTGVPMAAARLQAELLHVPYFAPPLYAPMPVVATIPDVIPLLLPEYRRRAAVRAYLRLVSLAARRVAHTLALSEHSRADIVAHLGQSPARVTATPLATDARYREVDRDQAATYVAERYGLHEPFVYYVGGLDARKNLRTLVRAFGRLRRSGGPAACLAIAGRALGSDPALFPDLDALIAEEQLERWVRRLDVTYAEGPLLHAAATAFAFPSRYEGFGLPPLEALSCGTPVVVADASSLPEVVGDAALRVPPDDVPGWTTALWRVLGDAALRTELRRRGYERAQMFSYDRVARETLAVYEQVLARF